MSITTDRNHPGVNTPKGPGEQNEAYLVLSSEELARGFVRPVRAMYVHVGKRPKYALLDLTQEQVERLGSGHGYAKFEPYPPNSGIVGRYWTQADLDNKGCGTTTTMAREIAETYAREPAFYGATWCCYCRKHLPVEEFQWLDGSVVGS